MLFELERIGAVKRKGQQLTLHADAFAPAGNFEESLALLARDTNDLVLGVEENIFHDPPVPNLHIQTEYDNICAEDLPKIRLWFLEQGAKFHARARQFLSQFDKDLNPQLYKKKGGVRVAIGSFSRVEDRIAKEEKSQKVQKKKQKGSA